MVFVFVPRTPFIVVVASSRAPVTSPSHSSKKVLSHLRCDHRERIGVDIPSRPTRFKVQSSTLKKIYLGGSVNRFICIDG